MVVYVYSESLSVPVGAVVVVAAAECKSFDGDEALSDREKGGRAYKARKDEKSFVQKSMRQTDR